MLKPGTRLGPYEVLGLLGAGGMGEVYKGRDTRLDRLVALKVLAPHLTGKPEARERFEREAKTVANLRHPNICVLYDIGKDAGRDFLVLEYLEGETLAQRIAKGPLPLEQVLQYATEVADALDKAHRASVTHRDIKPGNVMLVPSTSLGTGPKTGSGSKTSTKLLDFGLAKLKQEVTPNLPRSEWPTGMGAPTVLGTILGTPHYMAPEQAEGKVDELDARTDIFSFGSTVYEMVTGKKAFDGQTPTSVIAKILETDPPPMSTLQPLTPPALDRVVKKCLRKAPDDRWQTARDVAEELEWIAESGKQALISPGVGGQVATPAPAAPPVPARRTIRDRLGWVAAAVFLLLAATVAMIHFREAPARVSSISLAMPAPENADFVSNTSVAVSPDGSQVAFVAVSGGKQLLWVRPLGSLTARSLPGTEGAVNPFWSPDSRYLGFFAAGKLYKIAISGGPAQPLSDTVGTGASRTGTWNRDGTIVFVSRITLPLYRISAAGGQPTPVTTLDPSRQEGGHVFPNFLPDGRHFLYHARSAKPENNGIYVGSLDSKETKFLLQADSGAMYSPPGYLLFLRGDSVTGQTFDAGRLELRGEPFFVAGMPRYDPNFGAPPFSTSENGVLVYRNAQQKMQLAWVDREGKQLGSVGPPGEYRNVELSPDGGRVVLDRYGTNSGRDLWLYDLSRGTTSRFTFDPADESDAFWSPDGQQIVFGSNGGNSPGLYRKSASGVGQTEMLVKATGITTVPRDWSADGRFVLYQVQAPKTVSDLWVLPLFGDRKPIPFLQTEFSEQDGRFSPNGRWIAYHSNESGRFEVYVQSFPASAGKWQISTEGGYNPKWRRDGKELFYMAADGKFMAAPVNAGATFETGVPKALFQTSFIGLPTVSFNHYAVSADGQRFLLNVPTAEGSASPITVVLNWTAGLKK